MSANRLPHFVQILASKLREVYSRTIMIKARKLIPKLECRSIQVFFRIGEGYRVVRIYCEEIPYPRTRWPTFSPRSTRNQDWYIGTRAGLRFGFWRNDRQDQQAQEE